MNHEHLCDACGKPDRAVPVIDSDGSEAFFYDCYDSTCINSPYGLLTITTTNGSGDVKARTKFQSTDTFQDMAIGRPSQGESNVSVVVEAFVFAANRDFMTQYHYKLNSIPKCAREESGYDCIISSNGGRQELKLQIARALPRHICQKQGEQGRREVSGTTAEAAMWILKAIEKKEAKASPDIALVIDAVDVPPIGVFADIAVLEIHGEKINAHAQKWHSIWLIGNYCLRQLGGKCLPGTEADG